MKRLLPLALVAAMTGCSEKAAPPKASPPPPPAAAPEPEPSRITVQHVLVAFAGAARSTATRTKEEAGKLALEVLDRAKKGEDIGDLARQYSSDPGGGRYTLLNTGVSGGPKDIPRDQFIKPFVDVAFKLKVGEVGLVNYDPERGADGRPRSPFGWHVIKRLE